MNKTSAMPIWLMIFGLILLLLTIIAQILTGNHIFSKIGLYIFATFCLIDAIYDYKVTQKITASAASICAAVCFLLVAWT
ncbi:hypothetical protein [Leuconostoc carnosum]|uniref:hypothetical protein n=1 Tax=Leuconostoc carnosum TaxID=1252 RepID=UPI00345D7E6C